MSYYLNLQHLYVLPLSIIVIVAALSVIGWITFLARRISNQREVRIGARRARRAERERMAQKFGKSVRPISRKKIVVETIKDFWGWIWTKLVMLSMILGMTGLGTYYLDNSTFGRWMPPEINTIPDWWLPASWALAISSVLIIFSMVVLDCLRDDRARNEHGTAKALVMAGRLIGIGVIIFGAASHSRSFLWMGMVGGLAIIGSAQWLRASYRS